MIENLIKRRTYNAITVLAAQLLCEWNKLGRICSWQVSISSKSDEIVSTLTEDTKQKLLKLDISTSE